MLLVALDFFHNMYRIEIEDVAANYFIYHSLLNDDLKFVRFSTLYEYGITAAEKLTACGKDTIFERSWEANLRLFKKYAEFFCRHVDNEGYVGVMLCEGISRFDIIIEFLGQIPVDVQKMLEEILKEKNK